MYETLNILFVLKYISFFPVFVVISLTLNMSAATMPIKFSVGEMSFRYHEMELHYKLLMPLNADYDPTWCRDTFLKQLFAETYAGSDFVSSESSSSSSVPWELFTVQPDEQVSVDSHLESNPQSSSSHRLMTEISDMRMTLDAFSMGVPSGRMDMRNDDLLKRSSLFFMVARVMNKLRIMQTISSDRAGMKLSQLPHKLFTWSLDGLFKRCALPSTLYLDVLVRNYDENVLDWAKFSTDLLEILRYYKYFLTVTYNNKGNQNRMRAILWDQQQLLNIVEQLDSSLNVTMSTLQKIEDESQQITKQVTNELTRNSLDSCIRRTADERVLKPIECRYARAYYKTLAEMQAMKDEVPIVQLEKEIQDLNTAISSDASATYVAIVVNRSIIEVIESVYLSTTLCTLHLAFTEVWSTAS